jgi:hypothetical protein
MFRWVSRLAIGPVSAAARARVAQFLVHCAVRRPNMGKRKTTDTGPTDASSEKALRILPASAGMPAIARSRQNRRAMTLRARLMMAGTPNSFGRTDPTEAHQTASAATAAHSVESTWRM